MVMSPAPLVTVRALVLYTLFSASTMFGDQQLGETLSERFAVAPLRFLLKLPRHCSHHRRTDRPPDRNSREVVVRTTHQVERLADRRAAPAYAAVLKASWGADAQPPLFRTAGVPRRAS
jgi:hypothetical protein